MVDIDTLNTLSLPKTIDTSRFVIANSQALVHLYAKDTMDIMPAYKALMSAAKDYEVYRTDRMPARWNYNKENDRFNRIGDIILVSHPPKIFNLYGRRMTTVATHGFDPTLTVMHATFYAWGPAFKSNLKIRGFENINIYPLVTNILQLKITDPVDGNLKVLKPILK